VRKSCSSESIEKCNLPAGFMASVVDAPSKLCRVGG
jgi:hypothetical protein